MILMLNLIFLLFVSTNQAEDILEPCVSSIVSELRKIKTLEAEIQELRKQITEQPKVAFWAIPSSDTNAIGPFQEYQTVVYKSALTNIGNAYDTETGIFTAPVRGVYYFNIVVFNANSLATGVHIMKNGARVAAITDNVPGQDSEDTASNSVTLLLEKGDQIYNHLLVNRKIYTDSGNRNSFSGHLLYAMPKTD
ncbi:hypothetical protein PGIGA_G00207280 [Pangasianodon gigas]|uniref:Uncharacterized protein n=1 Tax=Pangasianodon gigas TaxID=30993 RepID=A0ACC5WFX5_PANGG|nr:hypothetical protein [Pangasianodon gigas]